KEEAPEAIVAAVRAAARGEGYFSPGVAGKVEAWTRGEPPGGLTDREFDVLRLVAEGLTNRQIAQALDIAEHRRFPRQQRPGIGRRFAGRGRGVGLATRRGGTVG
ncbi:MAG TPA: response regulator transcription factor, partial [Chloroflexi bacterium]|nr:response regulator transcription factor [Chloroflexota bacterium]